MMIHSIKRTGLGAAIGGAVAAAALLASAGSAQAGTGNSSVIGTGPDFVYPGGEPLASAQATVSAGALGNGNSQITLHLTGVDAPAGTAFGAHVHQLPCGETGAAAGPHYGGEGVGSPLKNHEVWLDFGVDAHGRGRAVSTNTFEVTDRVNRSVVIHAMTTDHDTGAAGARLACIDLDA